jgi:GT2 family glycosyltransferase
VSPNNPQAQHVVTAVIVAHDGAAWIPRVIEALVNQTRPVQRVVGVDTGSRDRSGAMLAEALGRGAVFGMDRGTGYAAAVHRALRHRAATTHLPPPAGGQGGRTEWVWLLHDDCEPEADALERLLRGAEQVPGVAVAGPKLMDWSDRSVVLEAGVGIDRAGRRITGIEPREVDQGQHDGDRDVLAVCSAGMLVRRDVWEQVGGFDPGMLLYREDVDFCWRVQAAGYRVRVITDAVAYHVEASARNRREASAAPRRGRQDRRSALLVLLGNLPGWPMLSALAGNLVLSALRTLFFLLAKRPRAALDELAAFTGVAGHPLRLRAARRRRSRGRRAVYGRLRAEVPHGHSIRRLAEFATSALSRSLPVDMVGSHHAAGDPADDDWLLVDTGLAQRLLTNPGVLLFLALTAIALAAERSLLSTSPLGGGALVPAWGGASGLWAEYVQGFHPAGLGTAASTPPYVAVIALLATLLGGKPWLAVDVILIGCVPLAGVTAYLASRRITRSVPVRVWAAAAYALLPVGMGAVAAGRLGTALALVLLPLIGVVAARVFTLGARRARRAAWAASLLVAVAAAFVPLIWVLTAVAMVIGAIAFRRGRPAVLIDAAIVAVVPVVLLLPWSVSLATHPSQLLLEAGLQQPGLAAPRLSARSLLLLSPGGPGLPPFWVTAGLVLAAAVALLAAGRRSLVLAGWCAALLGLVAAAGLTKVIVTPAVGGTPVHAWPGPALVFAGAGLLLAALAAGDAFAGQLGSGGWRRPSGIAVVALAAVACTAPVLAGLAWVTSGVRGPVAPAAGPVLPEFVSVASDTGLRVRTLVLRVTPAGRVTYSVLRDSDPLIGASELAVSPAAQQALNLTVAALAAPSGGAVQDQGRSLAQFGIGYVLLPAPVNATLARLLDGVPGLSPVSQTAAFQLWRVSGTVARVRVAESGGTMVAVQSGPVTVTGATVPAAGGTLVLAEPVGGWSAALNGRPLTPLAAPVDGWAQGFRLPSGGGSLTIGRSQFGRALAITLEALAVAIVAGLGLPGAKVASEAEVGAAAAAAARRGSGQAPEKAPDSPRERRSLRPGKGKPDTGQGQPGGRPRPRVRRPPAPAAGDGQRAREAAPAGARAGPPAGPPARADGSAPAPALAGGLGPDSPTMVGYTSGGAGVPGQGAGVPGRGAGRGSTDGRGVPAHAGGVPRREDPGTNPGRPRHDRRRPPDRTGPPGYQPATGGRGARLDSDPGASAGRGRRAYGPPPGRGGAGYAAEAGPGRSGYGAEAGPGRPGYGTDAGRGRPGHDTDAGRARPGSGAGAGPGRPGDGTGAGRARPADGPDAGRGRPGYDTDAGRARPGYDPGAGRGGRPAPDRGRAGYPPVPGRDGRPGYAPAPGGDGRRGYDPGAGRGRPGYDPDAGRGRSGSDPGAGGGGRRGDRPAPDRGQAGYPVPGRDGRPGNDPAQRRGGRPGHAPVPGGGRHGSGLAPGSPSGPSAGLPPGPPAGSPSGPSAPPPGPPADRGRRRGRIGWPGRGGRSGPDRGERPGREVPRGRPPGDDEGFSPLQPLPPLPQRTRGPAPGTDRRASGGVRPDWDSAPPQDQGETDW